ncbi:MAG: M15 family metallopeptidase [Thermoanaerobaculaceae bacterium]|nr:M15 family metallopeptidase [Thermoanaerobaculaceae bacterium]MDI9620377.1 M15 family metallopeptidase [Acidobacteriota bacterium]NLH10425.1 M15 family metallopeptidase [Holophagae bacterium]HPW56483.1 M15 family metallopeptidase [Thermoanaerobaculaceae bacterium]
MPRRLRNALGLAALALLPLLGACAAHVGTTASVPSLPAGFVYVDELIPDAILDVRYCSTDNFVGRRIDGYLAPRIILTREAAEALAAVAAELRAEGLLLKLFDGYRPQTAVNHFVRWAEDLSDQEMKLRYYPEVDKRELFARGYIAERSGHSRGSTIDLTLVDGGTGEELDMGSGFDLFAEISHHGTDRISAAQTRNRERLRDAMLRHGFVLYPYEWWHYTLAAEPFPTTYYDFPVR